MITTVCSWNNNSENEERQTDKGERGGGLVLMNSV